MILAQKTRSGYNREQLQYALSIIVLILATDYYRVVLLEPIHKTTIVKTNINLPKRKIEATNTFEVTIRE